jgi:uncharacterized protein
MTITFSMKAPLVWLLCFSMLSGILLLSIPAYATDDDIWDAAYRGKADRVKTLLKRNPKLATAENEDGEVPLDFAVRSYSFETVKLLIDAGADVNHVSRHSVNEWARDKWNPADYGRNRIGDTPLYEAVSTGVSAQDEKQCAASQKIVALLLDSGAKVNQCSNIDYVWKECGSYPVELCLWKESKQTIALLTLLVAKGAKVNITTKREKKPTILHLVAEEGSTKLAAILIAAGADVNATDKNGDNPLYYSKKAGRKTMNALLIKHGAVNE